jgi:anti-anti-sigma factor
MHILAQEHWNGDRVVGGATTRAIVVEEIRDRERTTATEERVMTVFLEESTHFAVLVVEGTLRAPIRPELRHRVKTLLSRGERRIMLELARLTDIDAAGIGELIRIYKATIAVGGVLQVTHPHKRVRQLLDLAATLDLLTDASGDCAFRVRPDVSLRCRVQP